MNKTRLEAFSDGVIAIIITIMVLELKAPHGNSWEDFRTLLSGFVSYGLSFVFIGIYWVNHHHLVHSVKRVTPRVMWANLHSLFWLSLIPLATDWMGENPFAQNPVALYGVATLMSGIAYLFLVWAIRDANKVTNLFGGTSTWFHKGNYSLVLYAMSIALAYVNTVISFAIFVAVAIMWLVPDRRFEKIVTESTKSSSK